MELYQILCLIGIPTLSTLIVTALFNHFMNGSKKAKEKRSQERKADLKELFDEFIVPMDNKTNDMNKKIDDMHVDLKKVSVGTLASLRNDLLECYYSCKKKGYRNNDDTKNFNRMFNAYIDLGGNDIIEHDVAPSFHELQLVTQEEEIQIQHNILTKQETFEHTIEEVIDRSLHCPYYGKLIGQEKPKTTRKKKTTTTEDK